MNYEAWIWTELLAFDNTAPDLGVAEYLARADFLPTGISLLLSASDFVMLHEPLDEERTLFPDICARFGQAGNEERARQAWTNFQLRDLVAGLRARGIKVYFSIFAAYHHDQFHREWLSDHPEARIVYSHMGITDGVDVLARLADGTYYEDLFAAKLAEVVPAYGFDGWHGPDCLGPAGSLGFSDCSDGMIAQFAEFLGDECPAGLALVTNHEVPALTERMEFIWAQLPQEWIEFNLCRWESFWAKVTAALKPLGAGTMVNSANTKSAFEAMYHNGMDYRRLARLGVEYLVVETVAANLAIISGGHERHFDFAATLAEMKAFCPDMKLIFLHGVKDVAESYDLMRHAPSRLEREVFTLASQTLVNAQGELERCATGFMVCLGDGLKANEWEYLRRQWDLGFGFAPVRSGELTWVWSEASVDALRTDYPRHGTWPAYRLIGHLTGELGLQVSSICRVENLSGVTGPLLVPNADLLTAAEWTAVMGYKAGPVVLLGRLEEDAAAGALTVTCPVTGDYTLACVVLGSGLPAAQVTAPPSPDPAFRDPRPPLAFWDRPDYLRVSDVFWADAAEMIRCAVGAWAEANGVPRCERADPGPNLRLLTALDASGTMRTALVSCQQTYLVPEYQFTAPPAGVRKVSGFPYTPLVIADGAIRSGHNFTPLHIPPYGIIVMDVEFGSEA